MRRRQDPSDTTLSLFDWAFPPNGWFSRFDEMFRDGEGRQMLRVEEFDEDSTWVVRAEMPGIDPDKDVEIEVRDGTLSIRAEHRETEETAKREFHRREIRYGGFYRTLPLPEGVDESQIKASYADGVLEIRIPVAEKAKAEAKRVPVTRA